MRRKMRKMMELDGDDQDMVAPRVEFSFLSTNYSSAMHYSSFGNDESSIMPRHKKTNSDAPQPPKDLLRKTHKSDPFRSILFWWWGLGRTATKIEELDEPSLQYK